MSSFPVEKFADKSAVAAHIEALQNQVKVHWAEELPAFIEMTGNEVTMSNDLELKLKWAKFVVVDLLGISAKKQEDAADKTPVFHFNFLPAKQVLEVQTTDPDTGAVLDSFLVDENMPTIMRQALTVNDDLKVLDV